MRTDEPATGTRSVFLLITLLLVPGIAIAVPQYQGSETGVKVVVTRFDDNYPEEGSPTAALLGWLEAVYADHPAVEVEFVDVSEGERVIDFLRKLPAGSFLVFHGDGALTDTLRWDIRCDVIVNGNDTDSDVPFTSMTFKFDQDPSVLASEAAPDMISFLSRSALAMVYLRSGESNIAGQELSMALGTTDGVSQDLIEITETMIQRIREDIDTENHRQMLTRAIEEEPDNGDLYLQRALVNARIGEYEASVHDLDTAIELGPAEDDSYAAYGGSIIEILSIMRRSYNAGAIIGPGIFDSIESRLDEAVAYLDRAIELDPGNAELYLMRSAAHGFLIDWTKALEDLDTSIGLDPDNPRTLAARGCVNLEMGFLEAGIQDLSKAIELAPDSAVYYEHRAFGYQMMGDGELADADLRTVSELKADNQ
ncbi:MAG: hypothetical protein JXA64_01110 [Candidatus Fermentibacteraceae bacterium]|nr:hypothetical protein [Candidatus Fermentibacteraceae bacterium]MBN2607685.1 hypothetical protein [Candidatus Fermentibacteraceae bacterium]